MHAQILITALFLLEPSTAPSDAAAESLEVRYARVQMQLAEANLNRVEQTNKRLTGAVPSSVVAEYQRDVQVAKTQLDQVMAGRTAAEFQIWLHRAEAERATAETTWKNAAAVNRRTPGSFDALDIERLRLRAEATKLELERGQSLIDSSRDKQLQWEVDMLNNEIQRLKEEATRSAPFIRIYPSSRR